MFIVRDKIKSRTSKNISLPPTNNENVHNPNSNSTSPIRVDTNTSTNNNNNNYSMSTTVMSPARGLVLSNTYVRKPLTKKPISRTHKGRSSVTSYSLALRAHSNVTIKVKVSSLLGENRPPFQPANETVSQIQSSHTNDNIPIPPELTTTTPKTYQEALSQINPEMKYLQAQSASPESPQKGRYRDLSEIVDTIQKKKQNEVKAPNLYRRLFENEEQEEVKVSKTWEEEGSFLPAPITPLSNSVSLSSSVLSPHSPLISRFTLPVTPTLRPRKEELSPYSKYYHRSDTLDQREPELFASSIFPKEKQSPPKSKLYSQSEKIKLEDNRFNRFFLPVQQHEKEKLELLENQRRELREIRKRERENTVLEIRDYEKSYCELLDIIIEKFWHPLVLSNLISVEKIRSIFSIVSELFTYSSILSVKIDSSVNEWKRRQTPLLLGDILLKGYNSLDCYTIFVNNYGDAIKILSEERKINQPFALFLEEVEMDPVIDYKQLEDFIIAPVQYLPKHEVLLSKLLRLTDKSDVDKAPLTSALVKLKKLITSVNESKRQSELMKMCQAKIRKYNIYSSGRKFIRDSECECTKAGKQIGKSKYNQLFLFNDLLLITKPRKNDPSQFKVVYDISLDLISICSRTSIKNTVKDREKLSKIPYDENSIIVKNNNKNYYYSFTFSSLAKKNEWESDLNKVLSPLKARKH